MQKLLIAAALAVLLSLVPKANAGEPDYDAIADNLVNQSAAVQPGEVVVIGGGAAEIELMGAIQVALAKAGGQSLITLNIPEANKRALMETPMEHLGQLPTANLLMTKMADVFINVGSVQDPSLFSDAPEERLAVARKAGVPLMRALSNARFRSATLGQTGGIPTMAYAPARGATLFSSGSSKGRRYRSVAGADNHDVMLCRREKRSRADRTRSRHVHAYASVGTGVIAANRSASLRSRPQKCRRRPVGDPTPLATGPPRGASQRCQPLIRGDFRSAPLAVRVS